MLKMYSGLHVKYRYSCQILMKTELSLQIFEKCSNIKLPVRAELFQADEQTDMMKLTLLKNQQMRQGESMIFIDAFQILLQHIQASHCHHQAMTC
jgi:hypothetical protein